MALSSTADAAIRTIGSLYEAGFQPDRWPDALDDLRQLFDGAIAVTFIVDSDTGDFPVWHGVGTEPGEDEYIDGINRINPRAHLSMALKPGEVVYDHRVLPERAIRRDPFYDWLQQHGLRYFVGTRLFEDGSLNAFTGIDWTPKQGHVTEQQVALFERMVPHLAQAVRLTLSTDTLRERASSFEAVVDGLDHGILMLDKRGRVGFVNAQADAILARGDGLLVRDGELRALKSVDTRNLHEAIAAVLRGQECEEISATEACLVARYGFARPYLVSVCPASRSRLGTVAPDAAVFVVIRDLDARAPPAVDLRQLFGLTAREAEMTAALGAGMDLKAAAARLGVAPNTARVHLQAIFRKTGVRSQVELAALLARFPR